MTTLTEDQINAVVAWMNKWEQLKDTVIPIRFKEEWTNKLKFPDKLPKKHILKIDFI